MNKHEQFIKRLCKHEGVKTHRWITTLAEAIYHQGDGHPEWQKNFPIVDIKREIRELTQAMTPDAFKVILEENKLIWWEVEISHPMPDWKIQRIGLLELELLDWNWKLELRVVDKYGNDNQVYPVKSVSVEADILSEKLYSEFQEEISKKIGAENATDRTIILSLYRITWLTKHLVAFNILHSMFIF